MKKEIIVFQEESIWGLPENIDEFLKYFTDKFAQIPAEYRDDACVEVSGVIDYGDPQISIKISYLSPETDKEKSNRERQENERFAIKEQYELREFERLSKKYNQA